MAKSTCPKRGNDRATTFSITRPSRSQNNPGARSVQIPCTDRTLNAHDCVICGVPGCPVISHRIATVQFLKRIARTSKKKGNERLDRSSRHVRHLGHAQTEHSHVAKSPSNVENLIDPFTAFPVPGASKDIMRQFHDFFTHQGGFVTDNNRKLVFDQRGFAYLYPAAMQNPALCMSVVALATSYNAVHFRERVTPDSETLSIFSQAFQLIRAQMDETKSPEIVEYTIHAVHRLAMACGIGFGDANASVTHWNGVLAFLDKYPHLRSSGRVMGYVTQVEYWVAIYPGVKPKSQEWPVLLLHDKPPPKRYGEDFPELLDRHSARNEIASKLLSVALTSCRATELLEAEVDTAGKSASRQGATTAASPYFMHLFDVLLRQQAQLYTALMHQGDLLECVCITLNIYFMIVLRCTPWRAPVEHLCVRLRDRLMACDTNFELGTPTSDSSTTSPTADCEDIAPLDELYLWMLIVCACALQLCRNRLCQEWALDSIRTICRGAFSLANESGQAEILCRMRRFCWSDTFLLPRFEELCSELK